jgi:hypothetical protein
LEAEEIFFDVMVHSKDGTLFLKNFLSAEPYIGLWRALMCVGTSELLEFSYCIIVTKAEKYFVT